MKNGKVKNRRFFAYQSALFAGVQAFFLSLNDFAAFHFPWEESF